MPRFKPVIAMPIILGFVSLSAQVPVQPNHLEPIPVYYRTGSTDTTFQFLVKEDSPELWMIVKPSFSPSYAVVLGRRWNQEQPRRVIGYRLRYACLKKMIGYYKVFQGQRLVKVKPLKASDLVEQTVEFPQNAAEEISRVWSHTVRNTHYPKESMMGLDGTIYEFYADYGLFGQTWSPESGVPLLMTKLGEALIQFVRAPTSERNNNLKACLDIAHQLESASHD